MLANLDVLILVPPAFNYVVGPMLGPAMLAGAALRAGKTCETIDLNTKLLMHMQKTSRDNDDTIKANFVGDHCKDYATRHVIKKIDKIMDTEFKWERIPSLEDIPLWRGPFLSEESIEEVVSLLINSTEINKMVRQLEKGRRPRIVALSIMFGAQVVFSLAISKIVRSIWPGVKVIAGGAHMTAISGVIDKRIHGKYLDHIVIGYAEKTFVDLISAEDYSHFPFLIEGRQDISIVPAFGDLSMYHSEHLTLPTQYGRGCRYGKCSFCTYPRIEGNPVDLEDSSWKSVVDHAVRIGCAVSFKDSLMTIQALDSVSEYIVGRVSWSACTKLTEALVNYERLSRLRKNGLHTLEIGIETVEESSQAAIDKSIPRFRITHLLKAAERAGISLVLNYIVGFPNEDPDRAQAGLQWLRNEVAACPNLCAKIELNRYQVHRLASNTSLTLGVELVDEWPWSSVLAWTLAVPQYPEKNR